MSDSAENGTLTDAYSYVLALVTANPDDAIQVQKKYPDEKLRDLMGASAGVMLGIFGKTSSTFRDKVAAGLRFGIDGDEKHLDGVKATDDMPG